MYKRAAKQLPSNEAERLRLSPQNPDATFSAPTFSVIIPAYNCENTIRKAVYSALCQLGPNDEVIVVDDCSRDQTYEIVKAIAADDERVCVVRQERNAGRIAARCRGVLLSKCSRVLFLDADDEYGHGLISRLRAFLLERDVDVIHFGIEMWVVSNAGTKNDEIAQRWFDPYNGFLGGRDVYIGCFVDHKYQWNLVNKCFNGNLCRAACRFETLRKIQRGDDAYLYAVISYFAKSYVGLPDMRLYRYNFGLGQDSNRIIDANELRELCKSVDAAEAIASFLRGQNADDIYWTGYRIARDSLTMGIANKLRMQVRDDDTFEGIKAFSEAWGNSTALSALSRSCGEEHLTAFARKLNCPPTRPLQKGDTIASYYWAFSGGGAENVQRMLIKRWRDLGLNVVILLEREPNEADVADLDVQYHVLPTVRDFNCKERLDALEDAIATYDIKGIVYHQWLDPQLLWDLLLFKLHGLPFFIHCHGIFVHRMESASLLYSFMPWAYRLANGIVSLSEVDASYWRLFNPRTFVTVNPSLYHSSMVKQYQSLPSHRVLWLGRISPEKRPTDALEVFARVLNAVPDATLDFVGGAIDPNYERSIWDYARNLGIERSVNFTGWSNVQQPFYESARVFLMTSDPTEGYPLTLGECTALGVPCVMYDLPYLTLARESQGILRVKHGDIEEAANQVVRVLTDSKLYRELHESTLGMASKVESFDFEGLWKEVLFTDTPNSYVPDAETERIAAEMITIAYSMGINKMRAELDGAHRELDAMRRDLDARQQGLDKTRREIRDIKESVSFRVGRVLTALPRGARDNLKNVKKLAKETTIFKRKGLR